MTLAGPLGQSLFRDHGGSAGPDCVTLESLLAKSLLRVGAVFQGQAKFVTLAGALGQVLLRDVGRPIGSEFAS